MVCCSGNTKDQKRLTFAIHNVEYFMYTTTTGIELYGVLEPINILADLMVNTVVGA